jgi:preprotein translocase subunit SecG
MYTFVLTLHILLAFVLIIAIVFLQTSKGSALSMFGGGGDALFNAASGTSFIKKFTLGAAACFAVTSVLLTIMASGNRFKSVVQDYPLQIPNAAQTAPAVPGQNSGKAAAATTDTQAKQQAKPAANKASAKK